MSAKTGSTVKELISGLTGYEERSVRDRFGASLETLAEQSITDMTRALVFVAEKRRLMAEGQERDVERDAFKAAMNTPRGELDDYFPPAPEEDGDEGEA